MRASILQRIFRRVTLTPAEGIVLDAILSKANMFGKRARVAFKCLAAITGFSVRHVKRLVKSLTIERRLLRVTKRVLWPGHNAINVYDVVIPWHQDSAYREMESRRTPPRQDRLNNKGDRAWHPNTHTERNPLLQPARLCTEQEASEWLKPGSAPWYYAQGLTPPWENGETCLPAGRNGSNEG